MKNLHNLLLDTKNLELLLEFKKKNRNSFKLTENPIIIESLFTDFEIKQSVDYFLKTECFNAHVPKYADKSYATPNLKLSCPYLSYKIKDSLKSKVIRDLVTNPMLQTIVSDELGTSEIKIYSINTFWTLPSHSGHFTHHFHRDEDGLNFVTVFLNFTDTEVGDGHFEYILNSGHPEKLIEILKKNNVCINQFYNINKNSTNGYADNNYYSKIFKNIQKIAMTAGNCCIVDTWGLHAGSSVKNPRLVTWIRFSTHANTSYFFDENRMVQEEFEDLHPELKAELSDNMLYELLVPYGVT